MPQDQPAPVRRESAAASEGDGLARAFDGTSTDGTTPYVRLVPPADDVVKSSGTSSPGSDHVPTQDVTPFDPHDIERREYRLLARALTNEDDATDHRASMTIVQLVKFLRAAGVSVPRFPATGDTPDPGPSVGLAAEVPVDR